MQGDQVQRAIVWSIFVLFTGSAGAESYREMLGYNNEFYGANAIGQDEIIHASQVYQMTKDVGDWTSIGVSWWVVQQYNPNWHYDFSRYRFLVDEALSKELNVKIQVVQTPYHARLPHFQDVNNCDDPEVAICSNSALYDTPEIRQDWRDFCSAVVQEFYPEVKHFEIGNEPNFQRFYRYVDEDTGGVLANYISYPEYLHIASGAIQDAGNAMMSADPGITDSVRVIAGAIFPATSTSYYPGSPDVIRIQSSSEFLQELYSYADANPDLDVDDYFDIVSYHPYGLFGSEIYTTNLLLDLPDNTFLETEHLYEVMCENNDSLKQIWGTECGPPLACAAATSFMTEEAQALWANQYLQKWFEWKFTGPLFWWNLREQIGHDPVNNPGMPCWGVVDSADWHVHPAYYVWREWGRSSNDLFFVHIGDGPEFPFEETEFLFEDFTAELAQLVLSAAAVSDTIRIYLHAKDDAYYGNPVFLQLDTLPETASLTFL